MYVERKRACILYKFFGTSFRRRLGDDFEASRQPSATISRLALPIAVRSMRVCVVVHYYEQLIYETQSWCATVDDTQSGRAVK